MITATTETPRLAYSRAEAARLLSCSPGFVDSLIRRGVLRAVRYGTRVLIPATALQKLVEAGS